MTTSFTPEQQLFIEKMVEERVMDILRNRLSPWYDEDQIAREIKALKDWAEKSVADLDETKVKFKDLLTLINK